MSSFQEINDLVNDLIKSDAYHFDSSAKLMLEESAHALALEMQQDAKYSAALQKRETPTSKDIALACRMRGVSVPNAGSKRTRFATVQELKGSFTKT